MAIHVTPRRQHELWRQPLPRIPGGQGHMRKTGRYACVTATTRCCSSFSGTFPVSRNASFFLELVTARFLFPGTRNNRPVSSSERETTVQTLFTASRGHRERSWRPIKGDSVSHLAEARPSDMSPFEDFSFVLSLRQVWTKLSVGGKDWRLESLRRRT